MHKNVLIGYYLYILYFQYLISLKSRRGSAVVAVAGPGNGVVAVEGRVTTVEWAGQDAGLGVGS